MKRITVLLMVIAGTGAALPQAPASPAATLTPAERSIVQAGKLIEKNPGDFEAYNALAVALSRRARETSDAQFYAQAEQALQKSFQVSPGNFDGERTRVWLLLGKHEFAAALEAAIRLNKKKPDDVMLYGLLTDANVELGNYDAAEAAAQWMLDLHPGNLPGLARGAYLRELFGDIEGALELMNMAYQSTPPSEVEDAAWILTQMAHLNLATGKLDAAEELLRRALTKFPGYHYALGNLAKVEIQQKRYYEAVELLQQRYAAAPHAENLYDLAEALQLAGKTEDAKMAFAEFERKSLLETARADNSNRELIFYYADHAHQPAKALEVAQRELARRHDVFTLDSYAWALYANGQFAQARKQIERALAVGVRDATLLRHAGQIALKCGDSRAAERYLREWAELNTLGPHAARRILAKLSQRTAR
jgi:tetratricopeptide (TPR) repeat protein